MDYKENETRAEYTARLARESGIKAEVVTDVNGLYPAEKEVVVIDTTPDFGIKNRELRLWIGVSLFMLSLVSGIAAMTIGTFPELEIGDAVVSRSIVLTNQIVSFLTGAFGLAFVSPNVPKS